MGSPNCFFAECGWSSLLGSPATSAMLLVGGAGGAFVNRAAGSGGTCVCRTGNNTPQTVPMCRMGELRLKRILLWRQRRRGVRSCPNGPAQRTLYWHAVSIGVRRRIAELLAPAWHGPHDLEETKTETLTQTHL